MSLKIVLLAILLVGCNSITPTSSSNPLPKGILKLDSKGHTSVIIWNLVVAKSGDIISASRDMTIRVWDSKTGKEKRTILGEIGKREKEGVSSIALSPDDKFLAVGVYSNENIIRIYHYKTGKLYKILKLNNMIVSDLAFSDDGKYLVSALGASGVRLWDVKDFKLVDRVIAYQDSTRYIGMIKKENTHFIVIVGNKKLSLYSVKEKKIVKTVKGDDMFGYIATSQDSIAVSRMNKNKIEIYDYNLKLTKTIETKRRRSGLAYSPNGDLLISGMEGSASVDIYSKKDNYKRVSFLKKHENTTIGVGFLDNKTAVSAGGNNGEIYIWDIASGEVKAEVLGAGGDIHTLGLDGDNIAFGYMSKRWTYGKPRFMKLINIKKLKITPINSFDRSRLKTLSTTKGDYSLSVSKRQNILNIKKSGKIVASIKRDWRSGNVHTVFGFYKDYIISGGRNGVLKLYNLQGNEIATLLGEKRDIYSIAIDADRVISGGKGKVIHIWDLKKIKPLMNPILNLFVGRYNNEWIIWTPKGYYNASKNGEIYLGYHLNHGEGHEAEFLEISKFRKELYRPKLIEKIVERE